MKLNEIIESLPPDVLARAAPHLEKLERYSRQTLHDAEIARAVVRVLKNPNLQKLSGDLRQAILGSSQ